MSIKKLFCMGNPLLDISAHVDLDTLAKYELKGGNAILAEEKHMPLYAELSAKPDVVYVAGGATLNTARVAAWVAGCSEPWVTYTGSISHDKYGDLLVEDAKKEGLAMPMYICKDCPTGTCAVCVVKTERSLVANLSAASKFSADHMRNAEVKAGVDAAQVFYISGFFLTTCPPAMMEVAQHCNDNDKIFSMNLSAPFLIDFFTEPLMQALEYADILFGNEAEAVALSKKQEWGTENVKEIAIKAQKLPKKGNPRHVVFTQGPDSTIVVFPDGSTKTYDVAKVENIVDTNGAGDAFVGGFLAKFCKGASMEECVLTGHKSAGRIIQTSGCQWDSKFE